jgi:hypothetical protein
MAIDQQELTRAVYDLISDSFTIAPAGSQVVANSATTMLSLCVPGLPLEASEFADPWSPTNTDGSLVSAENFALLVDAIPQLSATYLPNGQSIDALYGHVVYADTVTGRVVPSGSTDVPRRSATAALGVAKPPTRSESPPRALGAADLATMRRKLVTQLSPERGRAQHLLFTERSMGLPQGRSFAGLVESSVYSNHLEKREAHEQAVARYVAQQLQTDASDPNSRKRWSALASQLQAQIVATRDALREATPPELDRALYETHAAVTQNDSVAALFQTARLNYELSKLGSAFGPGSHWHFCAASPQKWHESDASYIEVDVTTERALPANPASRLKEVGALGPAGLGIWSLGAQKALRRETLSAQTKRIRIRFKYARVGVRRPWLDASLFSLANWSMAGRTRHQLSTGSLSRNEGLFPLLPTALIVARDLELSGEWATEDAIRIRSTLDRNEILGFGPFALAGRFKLPQRTTKTIKSSFDGIKISAPGLQVIGCLSTLVPACPPLDG